MSFLRNRTVIGVFCILLSVLICFGLTPLFNRAVSQKVEIVRVTQPIRAGEQITDDMVQLVQVLEHIKECPEITVTWFRPDEKKDGGQYITTTGRLRRIDEFNQVLILVDDIKIPLTHVVDLDSEKLPDMNQMEW